MLDVVHFMICGLMISDSLDFKFLSVYGLTDYD